MFIWRFQLLLLNGLSRTLKKKRASQRAKDPLLSLRRSTAGSLLVVAVALISLEDVAQAHAKWSRDEVDSLRKGAYE